jgi:hypothetical protein
VWQRGKTGGALRALLDALVQKVRSTKAPRNSKTKKAKRPERFAASAWGRYDQ